MEIKRWRERYIKERERRWSGDVDGERGDKILEGEMRREKGGG